MAKLSVVRSFPCRANHAKNLHLGSAWALWFQFRDLMTISNVDGLDTHGDDVQHAARGYRKKMSATCL